MRALRREAPLLLLLVYGGAFAYAAFGRGVPAFDDHPGQLFRLWHALDRSLPAAAWTADWSPDWWGGYPELQFYPPGFALVGAAIRALLLWRPSVETVYRVLCAVLLLAPGVTTYALLARVIGDRWLALPPAFLALVLSADLHGGVEAGLRWGSLTTRLGLAWLPLLALALRPWVEAGRLPRWAPPLAALAILSHPSMLPPVAAILGLATGLALLARPGRHTLVQAAATAGFALALTAFWSLPFTVRRAWVIPLAWGDLSLGLPGDLPGRPVLLALGMAALSAWVAVALRRRPFDALLAALPLVLVAAFVGDLWLFRRGWSAIEPERLLDGIVHASIWAAGLGAGVIVERIVPARADPRARPILALAVIAIAAILPDREARPPTVALWPAAGAWPTLEEVTRRHHLDRLWTALRGGSDRVLFLTSSLRLDDSREWYAPHSHVTSLTPLRAGREIVHGTFTHPSPVAARFYTGQSTPPRRLVTLGRAPRRPPPARRAVGAPVAGGLRSVRAQAPRRHRRRAVGRRGASPLPRPRLPARRRSGGLRALRAARPALAARRADHVASIPRPRLPDRRRVDPDRNPGLPALARQERGGQARDAGGRLGAPRAPRPRRPLRGGARLFGRLARVDGPRAERGRRRDLDRVGRPRGRARRRPRQTSGS